MAGNGATGRDTEDNTPGADDDTAVGSVRAPRRRLRRWVWTLIAIILVPSLLWLAWWGWALTRPAPDAPPGAGAVTTEEYPWVVAIGYPEGAPDDAPSAKGCMGALVEPDVVVTAGHCLGHTAPEGMEVIVGRSDLRTEDGEIFGVADTWAHPDRAEDDSNYPLRGLVQRLQWPKADIGLVLLEEELPHETIPLANGDDVPSTEGEQGVLFGYRVAPDDAPVLWQQPAPIVEDETCRERMNSTVSPAPLALWGVGYDPDSYLCAGVDETALRVGGTDSGGPLVLDGQVVGVMAWGVGMDRTNPEYLTRVTTYAGDIEDQIEVWSSDGS
ncbi:trypsin-like serine protease [Spiractinospora alimapuensis]|uniref:S1 family peptidase n=1 Tax=Spiractinospora alimapuensis TaxID=2820884 RepID=UPI001F319EB8|nr:trypsin-like serine protease [Spiractinospora alimapuensis]QVQ50179.1 trypsin-like serine protease [Spiractinospora alimapuensis]